MKDIGASASFLIFPMICSMKETDWLRVWSMEEKPWHSILHCQLLGTPNNKMSKSSLVIGQELLWIKRWQVRIEFHDLLEDALEACADLHPRRLASVASPFTAVHDTIMALQRFKV